MNHERTTIFYTYVKLWSGSLVWICIWVCWYSNYNLNRQWKNMTWVSEPDASGHIFQFIQSCCVKHYHVQMNNQSNHSVLFPNYFNQEFIFSQMVWIHSFRLKKCIIIVKKVWYKELSQPLQWLQMSQHLNVPGHEQVQCSLQSLISLFDLPWLLVIKKFHHLLWLFFFYQMSFFKLTKEIVGNLSALPEN